MTQSSGPYCEVTFEDYYDPAMVGVSQSLVSTTDEVRNWAACLFEPDDIVELRCLPSKQLVQEQRPRKYLWGRTRQRHGLSGWNKAGELHLQTDDLARMNDADGVLTFWGVKEPRSVEALPHIRLNVYCAANPRAGRKSDNKGVALARTLFVDIDNITAEEAIEKIGTAVLPPPTLTINSGHGVHLYWGLLEPITDLDRWRQLQQRLIQALNSDRSIHDPARLMRLPGFTNVNGDPASCNIVLADLGLRYSLAELEACLPSAKKDAPEPSQFAQVTALSSARPQTDDILQRALAYQAEIEPAEEGERNSKTFKLGTAITEKFDLAEAHLFAVLLAYADRSTDPLDETEVQEIAQKSIRHVYKKGIQRGTFLDSDLPLRTYTEPLGEIISLDAWREQMIASRLDSLQHPGSIFLDGSTMGAGKSTADQAAMRRAGASVTFLPTHDACEELAKILNRAGLTAAAYPQLNNQTCLRFDEAESVQKSGLNVGETLCSDCQLAKECSYQRLREQARTSPHSVATHARALTSAFHAAEGKPLVLIHEECVNLLRPTIRLTSEKSSPGVPYVKHLKEVIAIAKEALYLAEDWGDQSKVDFASKLFRASRELIDHLGDRQLLDQFDTSADLGLDLDTLPRVISIPVKEQVERPERVDYLLHRAMRASDLHPPSAALRLAIGYCCGELANLCLVVDDPFLSAKPSQKGGKRRYIQSLVGVWRLELPKEGVVWLENAHANPTFLSDLLGRKVEDRTPSGRLDFKFPPIQYANHDVKKTTSANVVRGLIRGVLIHHPKARKVGVITMKCHLQAIEALETTWRQRIARVEYFRSGKDRASNEWLDCDLLLVLGTPRVPPSAVREGLVQVGDLEAASTDGGWKSFLWEGKTSSGALIQVKAQGYSSPSWASVHRRMVQDTLTQAIGRGRGVTDGGVPVVVISNEPLGLQLSSSPLPLLRDAPASVFECALSALNPKVLYLGKSAVSTSELMSLSQLGESQLREHLRLLSLLGLLKRKGARGSWSLPDVHTEGGSLDEQGRGRA